MRTKLHLVPLALGATLFAGCLGGTDIGPLDSDEKGAAPYGDGSNPFGPGTNNPNNPIGQNPNNPGNPNNPNNPNNPGTNNPVDQAPRCDMGQVHTGIGGRVLVSTRTDLDATMDRRRVKPFSALSGEFTRVLGAAPATLAASAATFGSPPARWYEEPQLSAVSLFTAFQVSFQGCLNFTANGTEYAAAPTAATASTVCSTLSKRFWSREASPAEIDACTQVAVTDSASEANARRRWAYACATLLTTSGFLSY